MSRIHGVTWLLIRDGRVLLERCPKKAQVLGVGEWFVPGGKMEADESPEQTLIRELSEEWPGVTLLGCEPLPIVEGSRVPAGNGLFLMRPFVISVAGELPNVSADGIELRWAPLHEALTSPVPQVRMMVAAAGAIQENATDQKRTSSADKSVRSTADWGSTSTRPACAFTRSV
jgi:8-oxo-dGTP diphosphatase